MLRYCFRASSLFSEEPFGEVVRRMYRYKPAKDKKIKRYILFNKAHNTVSSVNFDRGYYNTLFCAV